jgi:hypothetical protein
MVDKNDSLFREVDEELRREQFAKLWERYGIYIIGAAFAILVLVGGVKLWEARERANAEAEGAAYEDAVALAKSGKADDAAKAFAAIGENSGGYGILAELSLAGADLKAGKRAEALAIFDKIAGNRSADPLLADFARLQAASLRLGEADFTEMQNRLKPLTGDDSSWRLIARELLGTAALKAGKLDEARTTLSPLLADPNLTRGASDRIERLMAEIASKELAPAPASSTLVPAPAGDAEKPVSTP